MQTWLAVQVCDASRRLRHLRSSCRQPSSTIGGGIRNRAGSQDCMSVLLQKDSMSSAFGCRDTASSKEGDKRRIGDRLSRGTIESTRVGRSSGGRCKRRNEKPALLRHSGSLVNV
jgi:hypothetical protein